MKEMKLLILTGFDDRNIQEDVAFNGSESTALFVSFILGMTFPFAFLLRFLFFCALRIKSLQFLCRLTKKASSVFWKEIMRS